MFQEFCGFHLSLKPIFACFKAVSSYVYKEKKEKLRSKVENLKYYNDNRLS
jgi:hypothetical protein